MYRVYFGLLCKLWNVIMTEHYYQNKTALITGGSSGIGLAFAKGLLEYGASVTLLARDQQKLEDAKASLLSINDNYVVNTISCDVTEVETLRESLSNYQAKHGAPDILINSAGVARPGYVEELPLEVYRWTMDIDYHGTVNMVKFLLPGMLERGSGHIINISSMAGIVGIFGYTAYSGANLR